MSDIVQASSLPSLPTAGLDLINRSRPQVDRFAKPGVAVQKKFSTYIFFFAFILLFMLFSYSQYVARFMSRMGVHTTAVDSKMSSRYSQFLHESAQIRISSVSLAEANLPYAYLTGGLGDPSLVLSKKLQSDFSEDEQRYIVLREAGRISRLHTLREVLFGLALISIAGSICAKLHLPTKSFAVRYGVTITLAILFSLGMVQLSRIHEYEAEYFALEHTRERSSITPAIQKMQSAWHDPESANIFTTLFSRKIPYETRLQLARIYSAPKKTIIRQAKPNPVATPTIQQMQ